MHRRIFPVALSAVALLTAAGCNATITKTVEGNRVAVEIFEYGFRPNLIHANPGPITFVVQNSGSLAHNFTIERGGKRIAKTRTSLKGTKRLRVALKPGRYQIRCTVPHHDDLGEQGTIDVSTRDSGE